MTPHRHHPIHHPSEALLLSYAAGALLEAEALALSTHLTLCPECRRRLSAAEAIGGALLDRLEAAPVSADGLKAVLARLDDTQPEAAMAARSVSPAGALPGLPRALSGYVDAALSISGWRMAGPGVQQLRLRTAGGGQARLLHLKPGTPLPEHSHRGIELTVLLSGSYTDELGQFARGDMAELDDTVTHRPVVDAGEICVALIVTDAPLKFSRLMARIAQPFVGI
jgi:putative transcriptional regulator